MCICLLPLHDDVEDSFTYACNIRDVCLPYSKLTFLFLYLLSCCFILLSFVPYFFACLHQVMVPHNFIKAGGGGVLQII